MYPGAVSTTANKINIFGQITGTWGSEDGSVHGYIRSKGGFESIDHPGSTATTAQDINNLGQNVGAFVDEAGVQHGYVRTPARHPGDDEDDD